MDSWLFRPRFDDDGRCLVIRGPRILLAVVGAAVVLGLLFVMLSVTTASLGGAVFSALWFLGVAAFAVGEIRPAVRVDAAGLRVGRLRIRLVAWTDVEGLALTKVPGRFLIVCQSGDAVPVVVNSLTSARSWRATADARQAALAVAGWPARLGGEPIRVRDVSGRRVAS